jgi:hypothetical protein
MITLHTIERSLYDKLQSRTSHYAARGCQQAHNHAGHGGMHTGFMEPQTRCRSPEKINKLIAYANF